MPKDPLQIALQFLKFRPRSEFEIREKLKSKTIVSSEIEKTISVLKRNNLLDDAKFAKMWVSDRNLLKPTGNFLLKLELKRLGLSEYDISAAISDQDEEALARKALESKNRLKNADFAKKAQFLQRRGFGLNVIYKILKK